MYELSKVIEGLERYIDSEIINQITGWQKWALAVGIKRSVGKLPELFDTYKEHPFVKLLDVTDEQGRIDVDSLMVDLKKEAQKGAITFDVPFAGALTLRDGDLEKLHSYIRS